MAKKTNLRQKTIALTILAVVVIGLIIGTYLWQRGKFKSGADVEKQARDQGLYEDEATLNAGGPWALTGDFVSYRDGTLVRAEGDSAVYLIYRGTKRPIANLTTFARLHLKWRNVIIHPASDAGYLAKYKTESTIDTVNLDNLPNGLVVRFRGAAVYGVVAGKLKPYPSPSVFESHHRWGEISVFRRDLSTSQLEAEVFSQEDPMGISDDQLESVQMTVDSSPFRYRGGSLVRTEGDATVYYTAGSKKYPIPSMKVFEDLKFHWGSIRLSETGVLAAIDPATNSSLYNKADLTSTTDTTFLRARAWRKSNEATVHLTIYQDGKRKCLQFSTLSVFLNRFKANEVGVVSANTNNCDSTIPSTSPPSTPPTTPLPSGQVKCTVNGQARYTYWKEIELTDYAEVLYPNGITKMYEVKRADSADDPTTVQFIYNIKNTTNPSANAFASRDRMVLTADILFTHGRNGTSQINTPGELRTAFRNTSANTTIREWIFDDIGDLQVGQHKVIEKSEYTLPTNVSPDLIAFWARYNYYAGDNDWCYWPAASDTPYIIFSSLNRSQ